VDGALIYMKIKQSSLAGISRRIVGHFILIYIFHFSPNLCLPKSFPAKKETTLLLFSPEPALFKKKFPK